MRIAAENHQTHRLINRCFIHCGNHSRTVCRTTHQELTSHSAHEYMHRNHVIFVIILERYSSLLMHVICHNTSLVEAYSQGCSIKRAN